MRIPSEWRNVVGEPPRICVLASPTTAHAGVYAFWTRTASALRRQGIHITLLLGHEETDEIHTPRLGGDVTSLRWLSHTFARFVAQNHFSHVVTSIPQSDILMLAIRPLLPRSCRWITFAHGIPYPVAGQASAAKTRAWRSAWIRAARRSDQRIAISPTLAEALAKATGRQFSVVPPSVPTQLAELASRPAMQTRLGYVGRLAYEKDPLLFARITKTTPPHLVHIFGDGPLGAELREALPSANFHGVVRDLTSIYRQIDLLVVPSRSEGLSLVVLEASTAGVLPLVSGVGGIPDVIAPAIRDEVQLPPHRRCDVEEWQRRIARLQDPSRRGRLAAVQRQWVIEHYSQERATASLLQAIGSTF